MARYAGLHVMHFGTGDIEAVHQRLAADGVPADAIRPFQRTVETEAGPRVMRASAFGFPPQANPEALVQIAQHLTPELVFQPRYQRHDNGAVRVEEVTVCGDDPERYARTYARYTGHDYTSRDGVCTVELPWSRIRVDSPGSLPALLPGVTPPAVPSLVGFTVGVTDLDATRALLSARDVAFRTVDSGVLVGAHEAAGATVSFVAARPRAGTVRAAAGAPASLYADVHWCTWLS